MNYQIRNPQRNRQVQNNQANSFKNDIYISEDLHDFDDAFVQNPNSNVKNKQEMKIKNYNLNDELLDLNAFFSDSKKIQNSRKNTSISNKKSNSKTIRKNNKTEEKIKKDLEDNQTKKLPNENGNLSKKDTSSSKNSIGKSDKTTKEEEIKDSTSDANNGDDEKASNKKKYVLDLENKIKLTKKSLVDMNFDKNEIQDLKNKLRDLKFINEVENLDLEDKLPEPVKKAKINIGFSVENYTGNPDTWNWDILKKSVDQRTSINKDEKGKIHILYNRKITKILDRHLIKKKLPL